MNDLNNKNGSLGKKPRKGKYLPCSVCKTVVYRKPSRVKRYSFVVCSQACNNKSKENKAKLVCGQCSKEYTRPASMVYWAEKRGHKKNHCSKECAFKSRRKDWTSDERRENKKYNHNIRQSTQFKEWRQAVFERDDYTCQKCDTRGNYLEPHHIFRFSFFPEFRFTVANGVTLCRNCHQFTKRYDKLWKLQLFN